MADADLIPHTVWTSAAMVLNMQDESMWLSQYTDAILPVLGFPLKR